MQLLHWLQYSTTSHNKGKILTIDAFAHSTQDSLTVFQRHFQTRSIFCSFCWCCAKASVVNLIEFVCGKEWAALRKESFVGYTSLTQLFAALSKNSSFVKPQGVYRLGHNQSWCT